MWRSAGLAPSADERRASPRRPSTRRHLTALIAIPLAGLVILGAREVERNVESAENARTVAETIEHQTTAVDVLPPLQIERIVALGSARVDELDIDADEIDPFVAAGLTQLLAGNAERLDERLALFADVLDDSGSAELAAQLDESIRQIAQLRIELPGSDPDVAEVTTVSESVLSIVDDFLEETTEVFRSNPAAFDAERLILEHTLGGLVLKTANDEVSQIADVFVGTENFDLVRLVAAEARHLDAIVRTLDVTDDPAPIEDLADDRAALTPFLTTWAIDGPITWEAVALDPELYDEYLAVVLERLLYLGEVVEFVSKVGDEIILFADDADRDTQQTLLALLVIGLVVLALEIGIVRSFARPLRRLRDHATRIGDGDLAVESLPVEGPTDIQRVTGAVNDMASTLVSVDSHLTRLALGTPSAAGLSDAIPGPVGASVRNSVERLTTLTTDLQLSEERLQQEARHDGLTSPYNRFGMIERLESLVDGHSEAFAVLIIDLDGFKNVNDTNGQAVGDRILLEVAQRLTTLVDVMERPHHVGDLLLGSRPASA